MAKLVYSAITSLDGYVADESGNFGWAAPGEEVHGFINDLERPIGTYLYGRRMYDVMRFWETFDTAGQSGVARDFAQIWRAADKVVYSKTLETLSTAKTRIERAFIPEAIDEMKRASTRDITVGGPGLAAHAIQAGLIDEFAQFITPVIIGNGTHWLPRRARIDLELLDERRFKSGVMYLRYSAR